MKTVKELVQEHINKVVPASKHKATLLRGRELRSYFEVLENIDSLIAETINKVRADEVGQGYRDKLENLNPTLRNRLYQENWWSKKALRELLKEDDITCMMGAGLIVRKNAKYSKPDGVKSLLNSVILDIESEVLAI